MRFRNKTEKAIIVSSVPPGVTTRFLGGETKDLDSGFAYLAKDPSFEVVEEDGAAPESGRGKGKDKGRGDKKEPDEGSGG